MSTATVIELGSVLANRFVLVDEAGSGGMGTVYRARDLQTGQLVAVKVLRQAHDNDRFVVEAQTLAELRHPGIVSYVAHGRVSAQDGRLFLAMEWLEGCDLSALLRDRGLSLHETLALLHGAADALATAHRRGIVHRDIKPSNLFLRGGDIARVTLLDFGIAHRGVDRTGLTRTGQVLGTPQYMSPEQAQGLRHIGPAADVFSLGCVLFECLTGDPPFAGEQFAAVLSKLLFGSRPRLRQARSDLPDSIEPLESLLLRMLSRAPEERPADAGALYQALESLFSLPPCEPPQRRRNSSAMATDDQQLLSVIVSSSGAIREVDQPTLAEQAQDIGTETAAPDTEGSLLALLSSLTAEVSVQRDGSLFVTLLHPHLSSATDLARQAARCALLLQARLPNSQFVVCTGAGSLTPHAPEGSAIDAALALLQRMGPAVGPHGGQILVDPLTESLLRGAFLVQRETDESGTRSRLVSELKTVEDVQPPFLKPVACIGRDSELAMLDGVFAACRDDSVARGALVIGAPGGGKSRLRREFLRRLAARGEPFTTLIGSGDPLNVGESYGLLGRAIRRQSGIVDHDPLSLAAAGAVDRKGKLADWIAEHVPATDRERMLFCLSDICGLIHTDRAEHHGERASLHPAPDARQMTQQVGEAWLSLLHHLCAQQPVLLILEDLQWGDQPTVRLVDLALRELRDAPLMVLALGRPELRDAFPSLWTGRDVLELRLGGLSRRAGERLLDQLVNSAGGPPLPPADRDSLLSLAGGNPLYLEELVRARIGQQATPSVDLAPTTVLAMLQVRLNRIDPGARRVLRMASFFGDRFLRSGVAHLLGPRVSNNALSRWLKSLVEAELIESLHETRRFPDEEEFAFRHPLLPRAILAMLHEDDREILQPLADAFLRKLAQRAG